jgi:hypothetical protein
VEGEILIGLVLKFSYSQSWAYCAEERKSASFYLLRRNANLGFQKRNCSLRFKILDAIFNRNFYDLIWYGGIYLEWLLKRDG